VTQPTGEVNIVSAEQASADNTFTVWPTAKQTLKTVD